MSATPRLFFCRNPFPAPPDRLFAYLDLGVLGVGAELEREAGSRLLMAHAETGGQLEARVTPRGEGCMLVISLFARAWDRAALDDFAERTLAYFEALEARLGNAQDKRLPFAWPAASAAPGGAARILRRADFKWQVACYEDAPSKVPKPPDAKGCSVPIATPGCVAVSST